MRRIIELRADAIDDAGLGTGTGTGSPSNNPDLTVHVADLLPGEAAEVVIEHTSQHRAEAWGRIERRTSELSSDRVPPACPGCGGCAWQHLSYPAQCAQKASRVAEALAPLGDGCPAIDAIVPAPQQLGYRNKGKYVIGDIHGHTVLGAYQPRTHALIDTAGCRVVEPAIDRAAAALRQLLQRSPLVPYRESDRTGQLRYAIIRAAAEGVLVCLVTTADTPAEAIDGIASDLMGHDPVVGVVWAQNDLTSGALLDGPARVVAGRGSLIESIAGIDIDLDATAFFQINRTQAARIYADLAERMGVGPSTNAVDLYCGVGGVSFALARHGAHVLGIEQHAAAVTTANAAAKRGGIDHLVRFVNGRAAELPELCTETPDLLVVNPPRKGLDAATRNAVIELAPIWLAYISCGPRTLARDLQQFISAGYAVEHVRPYDLMPGTAQVETVVICRRMTTMSHPLPPRCGNSEPA